VRVGDTNRKGKRHDSLVRLWKICILASWRHALERNPHRFRLHLGPDRSAGHVSVQATQSAIGDATAHTNANLRYTPII
jgi:hypothetical protein